MGLATSFYNEKNSDIAEMLVKTLLETGQTIPDFLEEFLPEGFTADGQGDVNLLKFESDSDAGDADADAGAGNEGAAWGGDAPQVASTNNEPVWGGEPAAAAAPTPAWGGATDGW